MSKQASERAWGGVWECNEKFSSTADDDDDDDDDEYS